MDETAFQNWYKAHAKYLGLDPNPDNPLHFYDYRKAYVAGKEPDESGHWPSEFKHPDHPNRYVDGIDTITNRKLSADEMTVINAERLFKQIQEIVNLP